MTSWQKKCINRKKRREVERWRVKETAKGNLMESRSASKRGEVLTEESQKGRS